MARSRNIKPGLWQNEDLAECSIWARYLFPGLWTIADREGRLEDRPKRIKAALLPFDDQPAEPLLQELAQRGFIERYQVDGMALIQIVNFGKHQNPHHKEAPSELPPAKSPGLLSDATGVKPEALPPCMDQASATSPGQSSDESSKQGGKTVLIPSSLIPDSGFSDSSPAADATGPVSQPVTDAQYWDAGVQLMAKAGTPEKQARAFLGMLCKDGQKPAVINAIGQAILEQPADPLAYIRKVCGGRKRSTGAHNLAGQNYSEAL